MRAYGVEILSETDLGEDFENFTDFDKNSQYADYIATAKLYGIAKGYENGEFKADREITREEMFVFLYRTLAAINEILRVSANGMNLKDFTDAENVSDWSKEEITALLAAGLIEGTSKEEFVFTPKGGAFRAEMAQMILRLLTK